jgi:catechol 2,3-dioxygenase-like lactoylglutathione lyase family enzyme
MIVLRAIDHVVLRVADTAAMTSFYCDVLGARLERHQQDIGLWQLRVGEALVDFVSVDGPLGTAGGAAPGREGRNLDHLCFRVLPWDADSILAHLKTHGIDAQIVSRYGAEGTGPSIYIDDPEGNTLELKGPSWAPMPSVASS